MTLEAATIKFVSSILVCILYGYPPPGAIHVFILFFSTITLLKNPVINYVVTLLGLKE